MKAAILGSGSWGTAFATHLAAQWDQVAIWGVEADQIDAINTTRTNPAFFGDHPLPENLVAGLDLDEILDGAQAVFCVVPSQVVRQVAARLGNSALPDGVPVISLSKGLELTTLKRLSQVLAEELPDRDTGVLLGPSHAEEVIKGQPTALVLAGHGEMWHHWQSRISHGNLRVYTNHDLVGVEISTAFKNVIAIAVGICDGLGLGDNTRGLVMTRGLKELSRLGIALGGHFETFYGLAGVGDMITTCTSRHSRNRNFGEAVARSDHDPDSLLSDATQVVEGVVMTKAALKLSEKHSIELPITQEVHNVLFSGKSPNQAIRDLMGRDLRAEME